MATALPKDSMENVPCALSKDSGPCATARAVAQPPGSGATPYSPTTSSPSARLPVAGAGSPATNIVHCGSAAGAGAGAGEAAVAEVAKVAIATVLAPDNGFALPHVDVVEAFKLDSSSHQSQAEAIRKAYADDVVQSVVISMALLAKAWLVPCAPRKRGRICHWVPKVVEGMWPCPEQAAAMCS